MSNAKVAGRQDNIASHDEALTNRLEKLLIPLLSMQRSSWEQGHAAQAILEAHLAGALPDGVNYLYGLVHDAIVRQAADGRLAVVLNGTGSSDPGAVDPACIGESIFFLLDTQAGKLDDANTRRLETSVKRMLKFILDDCPRAPVPQDSKAAEDLLFSHRIDSTQIWSDTVYMLSPFLASAAVYYSRHPDPDFEPVELLRLSLRQIILAAKALQASTGEWSHIYDLDRREFQRQVFWGVGGGWVCGGIARAFRTIAAFLETCPESDALKHAWLNDRVLAGLRNECFAILQTSIEAILRYIRPDGLFHDILDDTSSFVETNLSQEMSYTLYRLFHLQRSGTLSGTLGVPSVEAEQLEQWAKIAGEMRDAAVGKTDQWGFVRDVCGSPRFKAPGTAAEGQAWAMLMEVAKAEYELLESRD
ncbi:hypothetical protein BDW22DRAFT_397589 [Trametopsis cervina]|nr:hypothetical protein BDW22DRAFT_397589 [Trametopsis cervina]